MRCIILLLAMFCCYSSYAQETEDVVKLNTEIEFRGRIISYNHGENVRMLLHNGRDTINIPASQIRRIKQKKCKIVRQRKPYEFDETGMYHVASLAFMSSRDQFDGALNIEPSLTYTLGKMFNRNLGIGIGTGFDVYDRDASLEVIPIFAEARGYLLSKKITPFYSMVVGYGIPVKKTKFLSMESTKGGYLFHPSVGLRLGGGSSSFSIDMGWRIQRATYNYVSAWNPEDRYSYEYTFKRATLRLSAIF